MKRWFPFLWLLLVASAFHADGKATSLVSRLALPNFSSIIHHYDSLSRLDYTVLTNRWGQVLDGYGYIHDPAGLRTNIVRNLGSTISTSILSTTLPATLSLKYDLNGNLTNDGTMSLAYDAQNQLVTNWLPLAWNSEHVYDGRLVVQERNATNGVTVTYTRGIDLGGGYQTAGGVVAGRLGLGKYGHAGEFHPATAGDPQYTENDGWQRVTVIGCPLVFAVSEACAVLTRRRVAALVIIVAGMSQGLLPARQIVFQQR